MQKLKIQKVGDELCVILPESVLETLGVGAGDDLYVNETEFGVTLLKSEAAIIEQVKRGRGIARRYEGTLRRLAK